MGRSMDEDRLSLLDSKTLLPISPPPPPLMMGHDNDNDDDDDDIWVDMLDEATGEWGGPTKGGTLPEPTRHGDWHNRGRCTDFE